MIFRVVFCERCDDWKLPKELIKWSGECDSCKRDTCRIALFDTDTNIKSLLRECK